jgi:hypothetical protein
VAGKMAYPLPGALLPYNRIIAFTEIYINKDGNLRRNSRAEMIKNYREVAKWPQILPRQQSLLYIILQ